MADPSALEQDAVNFANQAVHYDQRGITDTAAFYYIEAGQALIAAAHAGSQLPLIQEKAHEYLLRAEQLDDMRRTASVSTSPLKSSQQTDLDRAKFLIEEAFEQDESGNTDEAFELYTQAAELCLKLRQETNIPELMAKVSQLASQALDRAEHIKRKNTSAATPTAPPTQSPASANTSKNIVPKPLGFSLLDDDTGSPSTKPSANQRPAQTASGGYSKEEIEVLRTTSSINGREYVPFMSIDIRERFAFPVPFSDKCGKLALSPKQKNHFGKWVRPQDFCENAQMIYAISSFSIKQTLISDCSFVASLAISAQYERKFRQKLITSIIYPQNRNGEPQVNPCGKYMVKLNLNGVPRKVIIDDYLPMSRDGELLCSYSTNKNELWVSLLEKAYLKVMGGYDFPGSNSNIDLHALTGWIPERVAIRSGTEEFDSIKEFEKIQDRFHKGHCLVTMATGDLSEMEAERAGLVPSHAYAMLDVRIIKGYKLFQLKNPWSHLRWRGSFSELDTQHWTPDLQKALNFDPKRASLNDNGVFWIDYESVMKFYDVIYINWNPGLFSNSTCIHDTWRAKEGPKKDTYDIGDNPQYRLELKGTGPSAVWILLTRHITDKDDFANNREFITLFVYKSNGKRVYYPFDPPPYKDGVKINSPHYLCKMVEKGSNTYTLVVSQYEKNNTIHYTLRVYSTCRLSLSKISEPYNPKYEKKITGEWRGKTAGGCGNYPETYLNNPLYQVKIDNKDTNNHLLIELRGPKQYNVGIEALCVSENVPESAGSFKKKSSGNFRPGFCVLELDSVPGGIYNIRPTTFRPKQEANFFLNINSSVPLHISQLQ